jgi:hypothetical protein
MTAQQRAHSWQPPPQVVIYPASPDHAYLGPRVVAGAQPPDIGATRLPASSEIALLARGQTRASGQPLTHRARDCVSLSAQLATLPASPANSLGGAGPVGRLAMSAPCACCIRGMWVGLGTWSVGQFQRIIVIPQHVSNLALSLSSLPATSCRPGLLPTSAQPTRQSRFVRSLSEHRTMSWEMDAREVLLYGIWV